MRSAHFLFLLTGACGNQSASACGKDCRKDDYQGLLVGHLNPVWEKFQNFATGLPCA
jgi:hypothetical protein